MLNRFKGESGSVTVEATISLSAFMFAIVTLLTIVNICVVPANMVHTGSTGFELQNSAAYVKLTATIQVKPTLLALPIFADVESNPVDNSNWYTITYTGIAGY